MSWWVGMGCFQVSLPWEMIPLWEAESPARNHPGAAQISLPATAMRLSVEKGRGGRRCLGCPGEEGCKSASLLHPDLFFPCLPHRALIIQETLHMLNGLQWAAHTTLAQAVLPGGGQSWPSHPPYAPLAWCG